MTFSIVARCENTGMFGVAVTSSSPAVAARCAYARAGAGAVASQNITDPTLGVRALDLLASGADAEQTIAILRDTGLYIEYRQVLAVDSNGGSAVYSGPNALGTHAQATDKNAASGGNLLASEGIPEIIVNAFVGASGELGERILKAMEAGVAAGGEAGPIHSAGLKLVRDVPWPVADLRVDWTDGCPVTELRRLWDIYNPQMEDYVTRALDPRAAPRYGVPGDE
jgi:uncharacterized Ntn-hydrolase superfamily protein